MPAKQFVRASLVIGAVAIAFLTVIYSNRISPVSANDAWSSAAILEGYQVFYVSENVDTNDLASAARMQGLLHAQKAASWQEVAQAHSAKPIDVLIVHKSALANADLNWVSAVYNDGVVVALVDASVDEFARFINDSCIGPIPDKPGAGPAVFVSFRITAGDVPADVLRVKQAYAQGKCGADIAESINTYTSTVFGSFGFRLTADSDYDRLATGIKELLAAREDFVRRAANGTLQEKPNLDNNSGSK